MNNSLYCALFIFLCLCSLFSPASLIWKPGRVSKLRPFGFLKGVALSLQNRWFSVEDVMLSYLNTVSNSQCWVLPLSRVNKIYKMYTKHYFVQVSNTVHVEDCYSPLMLRRKLYNCNLSIIYNKCYNIYNMYHYMYSIAIFNIVKLDWIINKKIFYIKKKAI